MNFFGVSPFLRAVMLNQPGVGMREMQKHFRPAADATLMVWQKKFLPMHFQAGNRARYPEMHPRNPHYTDRKPVKVDLVFSRKAKRQATRGQGRRRASMSRRNQKMTAGVRVPDYLNKNRKYGYPLSREVVMHNEVEDIILTGIFENEFGKRVFGSSYDPDPTTVAFT